LCRKFNKGAISVQTKIQYEMSLSDVAMRIESLSAAGLRIAADNSDLLFDIGASGLQAILEQIHDLSRPLFERMETIEREAKSAA
jgi:hypothetical protein